MHGNTSINSIKNEWGIESIFYNHVEFEHSNQDDDWLLSGMEYGFLKNSINLLRQDIHNIEYVRNGYTDFQGKHHEVTFFPLHGSNQNINEIEKLNLIKGSNFILDIDLDCMTRLNEDGSHVALCENELKKLFNTKLIGNNSFESILTELIAN